MGALLRARTAYWMRDDRERRAPPYRASSNAGRRDDELVRRESGCPAGDTDLFTRVGAGDARSCTPVGGGDGETRSRACETRTCPGQASRQGGVAISGGLGYRRAARANLVEWLRGILDQRDQRRRSGVRADPRGSQA